MLLLLGIMLGHSAMSVGNQKNNAIEIGNDSVAIWAYADTCVATNSIIINATGRREIIMPKKP